MSGETVQKFAADFKKAPGIITLTSTHIAWVPNAQGAMDRQNQAMNRVVSELLYFISLLVVSCHLGVSR